MTKDVYSCEYMDEWKKFNEASLLKKEDLYCSQNFEDITDLDYNHAKIICKDWNKFGWLSCKLKNDEKYFLFYTKLSLFVQKLCILKAI